MKLGQCARDIFPKTKTLEQASGATFYTLGFLVALILWAFALVWLFFALASIARSKSFPFNIGWWGFTFPTGVVAASTLQMGTELPSGFFNILGTVSLDTLPRNLVVLTAIDLVNMCGGAVDDCQCRDSAWGDIGPVVLCTLPG